MSQREVLRILVELGGVASVKEIRESARIKFPRGALHKYVHVRLRQLEKSGQVKRVQRDGERVWSTAD